MGKYRNRLQIIADILSIVTKKTKKTHVMYQAILSYKLLSKYLKELLEAHLITHNDNLYVITPKGEEFLITFAEYCRLQNDLENLLKLIHSRKTVLERELDAKRL